MALSFLYRLFRRVLGALRVLRIDTVAKDAEILVLRLKGTKMSIARIDRGSNPQGSVDCSIVATGCPFVAGRFGFSDRGRVQAEIRTDVSRFQCL